MNNALIASLARLKIRLRRETGLSLNTQRFFAETLYAQEILDKAEEADDEETVLLAMELRNRLGFLAELPIATNVAPERPTTGRYVFGPRT